MLLKSCTSVTVNIDTIVVGLGEECMTGTVTGSTTTTSSKSPGNTTTTTRMTVTIKDVMRQGIETTIEREVGNNIVNKGDVGIETSKVAGEAGRTMAVQSSNRQRREKKKRKYRERKAGQVEAESARIASQQSKRAINFHKYQSNEAVKQRRAENERKRRQSTKSEVAVDSDMCSDCIDTATKRTEYDCTCQAQDHVEERCAEN